MTFWCVAEHVDRIREIRGAPNSTYYPLAFSTKKEALEFMVERARKRVAEQMEKLRKEELRLEKCLRKMEGE